MLISKGDTPIVIAGRNNRQDCVKILMGMRVEMAALHKEIASEKVPEDIVKIVDKRKASGDFGRSLYAGKELFI